MSDDGLAFVDLTDAEFDAYIASTVPMYAEALARALGTPPAAALERATKQIADLLPNRRTTPDHRFLRVVLEGIALGTLWIGPQREAQPPCLYVYDIVIDEAARGRGVGTRVMRWVEHEATRLGLHAVTLSVAAHNEGAVRLYERLGFEPDKVGPGGMSMIRHLTPAPDGDAAQS